MPAYTICPKFLQYAGENKKYINDVLMVFVPDNSKTICIDSEEIILSEYDKIICHNKELIDWYKFLTMSKDLNLTKVNLEDDYTNLPIHICEKLFDKCLITDCTSNYADVKNELREKEIELLDKDLAKVKLNYGTINFPKTESDFKVVTKENVYKVVLEICAQFKDVIENKGLFKLIIDKNGVRVPEKKAQLLFFGVAYAHCSVNDFKLSPEVDSGNGPVDFNFSKGFKANVNVEMKFADNPKLEITDLWSAVWALEVAINVL